VLDIHIVGEQCGPFILLSGPQGMVESPPFCQRAGSRDDVLPSPPVAARRRSRRGSPTAAGLPRGFGPRDGGWGLVVEADTHPDSLCRIGKKVGKKQSGCLILSGGLNEHRQMR